MSSDFAIQVGKPWVTLALVLCTAVGCGGSSPFDLVSISGKVLYEDDTVIPANRITITFVSQAEKLDAKTFPRPGLCEVNETDGSFSVVSTDNYDDGVIQGKHKVLIQSLDEMSQYTDHVPAQYRDLDETPLLIDTDEQTVFEFKIPKP